MKRVTERFLERAKTRDAVIDQPLVNTFIEDQKATSVGQMLLNPDKYTAHAENVTNAHREYMAKEGVQQYRDYYESDAEE